MDLIKNYNANHNDKVDEQGDIIKLQRKQSIRHQKLNQMNSERSWLFKPDHQAIELWNIFIMIILIITCIITPLRLAMVFPTEQETLGWKVLQYSIDVCFLIDIMVIFNTGIYNEYMEYNTDRKTIARTYLQSWFFVDVISILPFDLLLQASSMSGLMRIARISRLYKLLKLTRLLKVVRLMKDQSKILNSISSILPVSRGFERLYYFLLIFLVMCHIISCLWLIFPQFLNDDVKPD